MNDIDAKSIHGVSPNVIPVDAGDEDLSLMVVNEEASNHFDCRVKNSPQFQEGRTLVPTVTLYFE